MYSAEVIAANEALVLQEFGKVLPGGCLRRYPPAHCHAMKQALDQIFDPDTRQQTRVFTQQEEAFVINEQLLTKIDYPYAAERYCNPPEAPIWMGDLGFLPIGEVEVGDTVVGWAPGNRVPRQRRVAPWTKGYWQKDVLVRTVVTATARRVAPLVKVTLASGRTLRCTPDHYWDRSKYRCGTWTPPGRERRDYNYPWTLARVGAWLSHVVDIPKPVPHLEWVCGWLAGIYDGEGSGRRISQDLAANPLVHARIGEALELLGIPHTGDPKGYYIVGGRQGLLKFLTLVRPQKREGCTRDLLTTSFRHPDCVVAVEPDGVGEVVSLQTETGNYVAWGYASKNCWINYEGQALRPMYPLWESQRLILAEVGRVELTHWQTGHPDGILANILKGRQLGASTLCQSFLAHRVLTHGHVRTLIASDVPQNSGSEGLFGMLELVVEHWPWWLKPRERFHTKNQHFMWENGSRVVVESGKSMKGGLQDEGQEKGQIGRSKTYSAVHLSEITSWERPEQIDTSLLPAVPRTPRTLMFRESTALGRNNYWHERWKVAAAGKDPRFFNIFIPWYAEASKYWLPYPASWVPSTDTLGFAARAAQHGPTYMHRPVSLSKEQLYWYEVSKAQAVQLDQLYKFLSEYPSEPEEAFQHSGRSIFSVETMDRLERQARPLTDVWAVAPRAELLADAEASRREFLESQRQAGEERAKVEAQRAGRAVTTTDALTVKDAPVEEEVPQ